MPILQWINENHVGDLASLAGVAISVVGFVVTVWNVQRSKSAAERAETAANEARRMIRGYETLSEFSAAIAIMEEVKRLHRTGQIDVLLDRYAALRKALIGVRKLSPSIDENMDTKIQSAVTTLATMEDVVEKSRSEGSLPNFVRLNRLLSRDIDDLHAVLVDMRTAGRRDP
ncbi:MAG: hypothetical protein WB678_15265 [Stellaceae bacterium]